MMHRKNHTLFTNKLVQKTHNTTSYDVHLVWRNPINFKQSTPLKMNLCAFMINKCHPLLQFKLSSPSYSIQKKHKLEFVTPYSITLKTGWQKLHFVPPCFLYWKQGATNSILCYLEVFQIENWVAQTLLVAAWVIWIKLRRVGHNFNVLNWIPNRLDGKPGGTRPDIPGVF